MLHASSTLALLALVFALGACSDKKSAKDKGASQEQGASPESSNQQSFSAEEEERYKKRGRSVLASHFEGRCDEVWDALDKAMRKTVMGHEPFVSLCTRLGKELGEDAPVESEKVSGNSLIVTYEQIFMANPGRFRFVVSHKGDEITALFFVPLSDKAVDSKYIDYETKSELRLPLKGEWFVFWGGRKVIDNYHAAYRQQRFAYDFVIRIKEQTHTGSGEENTHYYAFKQPVVASASGTVVEVVDGIEDNVPGQMNPAAITGNRVVIDHGAGEFSLYAHLQNGSISVANGDEIERGQPLGLVGNSGNSSEPHLHFQLQDGPNFATAESMPAPFSDLFVDGELVQKAEPTKGQTVSNQGG